MTLTQIDQRTMQWTADRLRTPWLTPVMRFFTFLGDWPTWIALIFVARLQNGWLWEVFGWVGWAWVPAWLSCWLLKIAVRRRRPSIKLQDTGFGAVLKDPDPWSFPSSHTGCAWAVCVPLAQGMFDAGYGMWGWVPLAHASMICLSRIYLGAHYPSDVLGGLGIGVSWAMAAAYFLN